MTRSLDRMLDETLAEMIASDPDVASSPAGIDSAEGAEMKTAWELWELSQHRGEVVS
jgi:hypothetical protein